RSWGRRRRRRRRRRRQSRRGNDMATSLLVTMPWDVLASPSLALGTLHQVLLDHDIEVETLSLKLSWMDFLLSNQGALPEPIAIGDYHDVACSAAGLGDWVFAEPPIAPPAGIERYRASLTQRLAPERLAKLDEMRRLA